jgi:hypothetical protein
MRVKIHTQQSSTPVTYPDAECIFEKCSMMCVVFTGEHGRTTHKYPIQNIFRIENDYPVVDHGKNT